MRSGIVAALVVGALSACSDDQQKPAEIRPVKSQIVKIDAVATSGNFSGDVRARYESRLGFRVAGKVAQRNVDVGTRVKKGQLLARLDATDLQLNAAAAQAALTSAESDLQQARADYDRFKQMHEKKLVSDIEFSNRETRFKLAESRFEQAKAQALVGENQADYASLVADSDGVITENFAEVGQVVNAGQPVMTLAREGEREVKISVPESRVDELKTAQQISITLWAMPDTLLNGSVREIAPNSDPVTRTYDVRIRVANAPKEMRLGMTASVNLKGASTRAVKLPLSAIYQIDKQPQVWLVDADNSVQLRAVNVGNFDENDVLVTAGLNEGERVVTAGVNRLVAGQTVRVLEAN
jgi:RND family efflux transporter MFP subunit